MKPKYKNPFAGMQKVVVATLCVVILAVITAGCGKSVEIINGGRWTVPLSSDNPIINSRVGDVGFKFCLLNEDNVAANVFEAGENFYFYFVIENFSKEEITIDGKSFNHDLFLIFDVETETQIGKPFSGVFCEFGGTSSVVSIKGEQSRIIILPWVSSDNGQYPIIVDPFPFCCGQENSFLPKNIYSCRFEINLQYKAGGKNRDGYGMLTDGVQKRIRELFFEINFKIE